MSLNRDVTTGVRSISTLAPIWKEGSAVGLEVATNVFCRASVLRACYSLSGDCHVFVTEGTRPEHLHVFLRPKQPAQLESVAGKFANELVDQELRISILAETGAIRELIVAHALAEGDFLSPESDDLSGENAGVSDQGRQ